MSNGIVKIKRTGQELNDIAVDKDTIADLKAMVKLPKKVFVSGYHNKNDGAFGSNFFKLRAGVVPDGSFDNGGTVIETVNGVYDLQFEGAVNVKWFGGYTDGLIPSTVMCNNALDATNGLVYFPNGVYKINLEIKNNAAILGESAKGVIFIADDITKPIISIDRRPSTTMVQYNFGRLEEFTVEAENQPGTVGIKLIAEAPYVIKDLKMEHIIFNTLDTGLHLEGVTDAGEVYQLMADKLFFKNCATNSINGVLIEQSSFGSVYVDELNGTSVGMINITGNNNYFAHLYTAGALNLVSGNNITINFLRFERTQAYRTISGSLLRLNMKGITINSMAVQECGTSSSKIESLIDTRSCENLYIGNISSFGESFILYPIINGANLTGQNYTFFGSNVDTVYTLTQLQSTFLPKLISHNINFSNWEKQGWLGVNHDNTFIKSLTHVSDNSTMEMYSGNIYFNTTEGKPKEFDGKLWKNFGQHVVYGDNIIVNGTFYTDTDWVMDGTSGGPWSITNGKAVSSLDYDGSLKQQLSYDIGDEYLIGFDFERDTTSEGDLLIRPDGVNSIGIINADTEPRRQYFRWVATVSSANLTFRINNGSDFIGTIDNVEVVKITIT